MGIQVAILLYALAFFLCSGIIYQFFLFCTKIKKRKPDFDPIDCRNETRYLRYHYPEDKKP